MYSNIPTYFPGDTIKLKLRFHHEANLADVWANFEKEEEVPALRHFRFTARLRHRGDLRQLDRTGAQKVSEAVLRASVSKGNPLPGIYELSEVHGLPSGEERAASTVLDFEVPNKVRFRVADAPTNESPKVTNWELGWDAQPGEPRASY